MQRYRCIDTSRANSRSHDARCRSLLGGSMQAERREVAQPARRSDGEAAITSASEHSPPHALGLACKEHSDARAGVSLSIHRLGSLRPSTSPCRTDERATGRPPPRPGERTSCASTWARPTDRTLLAPASSQHALARGGSTCRSRQLTHGQAGRPPWLGSLNSPMLVPNSHGGKVFRRAIQAGVHVGHGWHAVGNVGDRAICRPSSDRPTDRRADRTIDHATLCCGLRSM